jgi:predicted NAD/FAD-binding protein
MPKRRGAWTSWNYITETGINSRNVDQVCLYGPFSLPLPLPPSTFPVVSPFSMTLTLMTDRTYWMNNLQHISEKEFGPVLVTLNPLVKPRDDITYGSWEYSHPQFTAKVSLLHELSDLDCLRPRSTA